MDEGHRESDVELRRLESKLDKEYKKAYKQMKAKTDKYFASFERLDKQKQELVAEGKMTQAEYLEWRKNKFLMGEQYEQFAYSLSRDLTNTNIIAAGMIKESTAGAYYINYNYAGYEICKSANKNIAFDLVDHATVERIIDKNPQLLPLPKKDTKSYEKWIDKDTRWNYRKIRSAFTQSLLQGESIPHMAKRLQTVTDMSKTAAVRNARTMTTGAESAGRMDRYRKVKAMGVELQKVWLATLDARTRDAHIELDRVTAEIDEPFKNSLGEIMCPGDPHADAANVYNCRCTMISEVKGFPHDFSGRVLSDDLGDMTYEEWKNQAAVRIAEKKAKREAKNGVVASDSPTEDKNVGVSGKDITDTWKRRDDEFRFEIEDAISAQGFDGLPKVVNRDEFDQYVKQANGGNGFIAQRTYSAPDQETLDAYRDQLYNGKWYVDCSTGGAQYGQGMYCAADYNGTLSEGIKSEMEHYQLGGKSRGNNFSYTETITLGKDARIVKYDDLVNEYNQYMEETHNVDKLILKRGGISAELNQYVSNSIGKEHDQEAWLRLSSDARQEYNSLYSEISEQLFYEKRVDDIGVYASLKGYDAINAEGHGASNSYTVILNRTKCIILGGG